MSTSIMAASGTRISNSRRLPAGLTKALIFTSVGMSCAAALNATVQASVAAIAAVRQRDICDKSMAAQVQFLAVSGWGTFDRAYKPHPFAYNHPNKEAKRPARAFGMLPAGHAISLRSLNG